MASSSGPRRPPAAAAPRWRPGRCALLLLACAVLRVSARAKLYEGDEHVIEVDPKTFETVVLQDKRAWVVVLYADWCGHCIHYAPKFKTLAAKLSTEPRLRFAGLNCAEYTTFCQNMSVSFYPTVRAFHFPSMQESMDRKGGNFPDKIYHDEAKFPDWLLSQALPELQPAASADELPPLQQQGSSAAKAQTSSHEPPSAAVAPAATAEASGAVDPESRLIDSELAALSSLKQGAFLHAEVEEGASEPSLKGEALEELGAWLKFLSEAMVSKRARRDAEELSAVVEAARSRDGALSRSAWTGALAEHSIAGLTGAAAEDVTPYWRVCRTYTCGLWTLFHMTSIAVAERKAPSAEFLAPREGKESQGSQAKPQDALLRIRGFVKHFFGCDECSRNFLKMFDGCELGRCDVAPGDARGAVVWLWRAHNKVTLRVANETGVAKSAWPTQGECSECWGEGNQPNDEVVYQHLLASYWRPAWSEHWEEALPLSTFSSGPDSMLVISLAGVVLLGYGVMLGARSSLRRLSAKSN